MKYTEAAFLYPPRPENAILRMSLPMYDKMNWVGQVKKNGTGNVIAVSPEKGVSTRLHCWTRHNAEHKLWTPTAASTEAFRSLPGKGWYVFVAELLHTKVSGIKDVNYINDILVADGEHLVGMTFKARQDIIYSLFNLSKAKEAYSHYVVNPNTWVAKNFQGLGTNFRDIFDGLDQPEDEGLVIKNPNAGLALGSKASSNSSWMVKIRRPTKNYGF